MRRFLLISTAVLALSLPVLAAWSLSGDDGKAQTRPWINCAVSYPSAGPEQVTCDGHIVIIMPFGTNAIDFRLVIDAIDNPPPGPSKTDQITACTIAINGRAAKPIHVGSCP